MGKSTISTGPFSIAMLVHQRVTLVGFFLEPWSMDDMTFQKHLGMEKIHPKWVVLIRGINGMILPFTSEDFLCFFFCRVAGLVMSNIAKFHQKKSNVSIIFPWFSYTRPGYVKQFAIENGPVKIVDFPIDSMVIFHCYVNVYQRVSGRLALWKKWFVVVKTMPCLPSPSHPHFYRSYGYHSQSWVVNLWHSFNHMSHPMP